MIKILIVEDDIGLNQGIALALKGDSREFYSAYTMQEAKKLWMEMDIDLVLLDINLPDGNGYDFLSEIRLTSQIPVIMLTANDLEMDEVKGLMLGADDYITKPFSLMVLRARMERILSRQNVVSSMRFQDENYLFDFQNMHFEKEHQEVILSKTEQKALRVLTANPGQIIPRDTLMNRIWLDDSEFVDENALSVTINRLRKKLECQKGEGKIKTIYGIGYVWGEKV